MKYHKIILTVLITCSVLPIYSSINPEIKKAVRKSHPEKLESLLSQLELTNDEKEILLVQAKEILKLCHEKMGNDELHQKKKRYSNIKLFLTSIFGMTFALCCPLCIYNALIANTKEDAQGDLVGGLILGAIGAALIKYDISLYKKTFKTRNSKQKLLDATEVEHILSRAS